MPTISEVHHVYTEPITTIKSDLHINPNLNQTRCVTGPNILNSVNTTESNTFLQVEREPNTILSREMCI